MPASNIFKALGVILLLSVMFPGCEGDPAGNPPDARVSTDIVRHCGTGLAEGLEVQSRESCVQWSYDADTRELKLLHLYAAFNCCAEGISATATVREGVITVIESEKSAPCDCNCLFDIRITVRGVEPGDYQVQFVEPYRNDPDAPLFFDVQLGGNASGEHCVERTLYPWGM